MSVLLVLLIIAAGAWTAATLVSRRGASDPTVSVRGFSQALDAIERAPRRFDPPGGRRP